MDTFYLGVGQPRWLERLDGPLFVSATRLAQYKGRFDAMPKARGVWALDSGGFSELRDHGEWRADPDTFGGMVTRFIDECGAPPQWCAPQDWMCEDLIIHGGTLRGQRYVGTGLSAELHQELTVENLVYLRREFAFVPWIPVLQAKDLPGFLRCIDMYRVAGIDLSSEPLVGLGSVCRRQATEEIAAIVEVLFRRGLRLHGFGVKTDGLSKYGRWLQSADSQAWALAARRRRFRMEDGACPHLKDCRNCPRWALAWRERVLAGAAGSVWEQPSLNLWDDLGATTSAA